MQPDQMLAIAEGKCDQALQQMAIEVAMQPDFHRVAMMHTLQQNRANGCAMSRLIAGLASLGYAIAATSLVRRHAEEQADGPATD